MQTEPPVNTCCGNSLSHQVVFSPYSDPWAGTALNLTCLIRATCTVHYVGLLVLCTDTILIEGTQLCAAVLILLLVLLYRAFPLCKVEPVLCVCLHLPSMFLHIQFARQIEELGLWIQKIPTSVSCKKPKDKPGKKDTDIITQRNRVIFALDFQKHWQDSRSYLGRPFLLRVWYTCLLSALQASN